MTLMCAVLEVARSGYYRWRKGEVKDSSDTESEVIVVMKRLATQHQRRLGFRRMTQLLKSEGHDVGQHRVRRWMREYGLQALSGSKKSRQRRVKGTQRPYPDQVERAFAAAEPNELWVMDTTEFSTLQGKLYLNCIMDAYSRRVVGWSLSAHEDTVLMLDSLEMAGIRRECQGVILHSDQGSCYSSKVFGLRCEQLGISQSMGSVGDCYDNAMAESMFATLKKELIYPYRMRGERQLRQAVGQYLEVYYNEQRPHSALGNRTPVEFEENFSRGES